MSYEKAGVETFQNLSSTERWQSSLATIRKKPTADSLESSLTPASLPPGSTLQITG